MNKHLYSDILNLGFKRESMNDSVFFKQYGFECFYLDLKISKKYSLSWDCITHNVTLYKNSNTFKKDLSMEQIKEYINLLK